METKIKTTLAKKNSEMKMLEQSKKSHLRIITSSAARLRLKYNKQEDPKKNSEDTNSRNIRMYETHYPGFCYLRNGEYRKKLANHMSSSNQNPAECAEKIKAILFTNNELDIYKTMCLHLLGTHIQNKNHIQRKDGRLCSYVKAQSSGNTPQTLQAISQRIGSHVNDAPTKYDKMLPRYILDISGLPRKISTLSIANTDYDSESEEETKKRRKLLVPVYINNEIRMIINSVMEALEAVESSKLNALKELASSPEELRNLLSNEDIQDFIVELANNPLVLKPTSYDYVMAHLMFDKIPEKSTMETVAQVLEIDRNDNFDLKTSLNQIRRALLQRHLSLMNSNILPRKKMGGEKLVDNYTKTSSPSVNSSVKFLQYPFLNPRLDLHEDLNKFRKEEMNTSKKDSQSKSVKNSSKLDVRIDTGNQEKSYVDGMEATQDGTSSHDASSRGSSESNKSDLRNLTNSQRILLGLKVASLKSKPVNMHQFEGKKKVDLTAIIDPIIRPQETDEEYKQNPPENHVTTFAVPEKKEKRSTTKINTIPTNDLENLTRALLGNLRLEISEIENKKRVNKFMNNIK